MIYELNQEIHLFEILNILYENLIKEEMKYINLMDEDKKIFQVIIQMEDLLITSYL
jgi:hypothetical protein